MPTVKQIIFYLFIAASLGIAIWGYLHLKESKEPATSIIEHIPGNAFCVIETNDANELISQLTRQNLIWNAVSHTDIIRTTQICMNHLDSLVKSNSELSDIVDHNRVYWSFIKDGTTFQSILQFKVKEKNNESVITNFFKSTLRKEESVSSFDAYAFFVNKEKWLACYKDGVVFITSDLSLLETCVNLDKNESIANNKSYLDLMKLNGHQNTRLYINPTDFKLVNQQLLTKPFCFNSEIKLNEITLNGYTMVDSLSFFSVTKGQIPQIMDGFETLPNNPTAMTAISVSDGKLYYSQLEKIIPQKIARQNKTAWDKLNDKALYDIKNEILENIDGDIILAGYMTDIVNSSITSIKIKDEDKAMQWLTLVSDSTFDMGELKIHKLNKEYANLFYMMPTSIASDFAFEYQNTLFLVSDQQMLNYYTGCLATNNILEKNSEFMRFAANNLLQECHYFYYENVKQTNQYHLLSFINVEELVYTDNVLSQLSVTGKTLNNNIQLRVNLGHQQEQSDSTTSTSALWSFVADSSIITQAYIFTNHITNEKELCFQDNEKQLYLISGTGKLLWKKKINETIQSEIHTVDVFKNGKLQTLFNSDNYLHLIDRNGNYVQGFPVKLPAKVTSDITLLDYDKNKDYRILIACADKKVYNYSLYGIKTEGFMPFKTNDLVTLPIYYVKVGLSDYLVTADVSGELYAFSRKGEGRIDFKNRAIDQLSNLYVTTGNTLATNKLTYLNNTTNSITKISLSDTKEVLPLGDELKGFYSGFGLLNDNTQEDIMVYGNGGIYVYDLFSSKIAEYTNDQVVYTHAQAIHTVTSPIILALDKAGQKVDVIQSNGKLTMTIPLVDQVPLSSDLYNNGKIYLLLIHGNKIRCQELN